MSSYELPATATKPVAHAVIPLRRSLSTRWISLLTLVALLAIWWAVTATGVIEPLFLPPPSAVLQKAWLLATTGYMDSTLWQHLAASLSRIGLGLGFAVLTAVPVGIAIGANRVARGILDPLIEFYRPIPPLAYLPLIVIWCGIGELSKVLLIYLAIFAPIAIATATGVRTVDPAKLRAAQSLGASRAQLIRHVILPSALPDILTGVRIGLGVGWSTLVAAELIAATRGLGFMVQSAAQFLVTDVVVLGILVIALIAFAMEMGLRALQRKLVPWHGQAH
ncbi:taurine ABC transporter permease TauC [Pseudomonas extremaustralis]|uniref:Taurine ABC transporter permease TauC n=1 Tax=Pseudomonas extremaustralis TaxID=359110 RepID=A0A5C5Q693_9PSED|nr:taurine ABC transporter permease TauC [Pseudomonas extremaustralis]EZI25202.1 taurine ABC transporter permease [Pseudomonas extremaustralis 14-3 substr. 14-3b]TWS01283.1 taurine ABC transporter permease TauC [Pseudomonas extremaustralis]SDF92750.1 taurine transport system permease protein [Pseudomonas extremaustralis]